MPKPKGKEIQRRVATIYAVSYAATGNRYTKQFPAVAAENRTDLTAEETAKVDALVAESRSLDEKIEKRA